MAKVRGPLMSVAASGTYRNLIVFKSGAAGTTAGSPQQLKGRRSVSQLARQVRYQNACQYWQVQTENTKTTWKNTATAYNLNGFQLWVRQYLLQNCTPPAVPDLPGL